MLTSMGLMLQIKDVPEDVHRVLKARAALAGVSLTEYARNTLQQAARRSSREELVADLSRIDPIDAGESAEQALAHIRDDLA
jgi:antitoxin FitA